MAELSVMPGFYPLRFAKASPILTGMNGFFFLLMILAMLAVLASLFLGLGAFVREGRENREKSQRYMRARVVLQGIAVIFFLLAMLAKS